MILRLIGGGGGAAAQHLAGALKTGLGKNVPALVWGCARLMSQQATGNDGGSGKSAKVGGKATEEQLREVEKAMTVCLPKFFHFPHNYAVYNKGIVFEDNIRNIRTVGLAAYMQQLSMVRVLAHLKYAHVKMHVLNVHTDVQDSSVKIRWQVHGVSGLRVLLLFWKFRLWKWRDMMNREGTRTDGYSILYVGGDGKVWKHVADQVVPDQETTTQTDKNPLAAATAGKLAAALAVGWSGAKSVSDLL